MSDLAPPFHGKFALVPLFGRADAPIVRNGHTYYALQGPVGFDLKSGEKLTAYAGQQTDLASIPRIVWGLLPPDGPWALASVFHDVGYRTRGTFNFWKKTGRTRAAGYSREEVDGILLEAMVALDVPAWKRAVIYRAVRMFGGAGWGK